MSPSTQANQPAELNMDRMLEHLGIDVGFCVVPRFGLLASCAQRNCDHCSKRATCTEWLATDPDGHAGPPKFCPNFDLLCELYYDSGVG
ncbi:MAG TPA: DUF6455 family protein, partial [Xanthobacteraceae bacterium]